MTAKISSYIDRLDEAFQGSTWFGNTVLKTIESVNDFDCNFKLGNGNSAGQIIEHMINWKVFVIEKLKGNAQFDIEINSINDWNREKEYTKEEFSTLLDKAKSTHEELIRILKSKTNSEWLNLSVPGREYPYKYIVNGIMQHDIYHSGQIAVLKHGAP